MDYNLFRRNLAKQPLENVYKQGENAYYMSYRTNVSNDIRMNERKKAKIIASYITDELSKQNRYKKMNTLRNTSKFNERRSIKKVYLPSPLGPRKTRRNRKH
jgi:hypothetical protein